MTTTDDVLEQRGAIYGDFFEGVTLEAQILSLIEARYQKQYDDRMSSVYYLYFSKIAMKLSRLSVCPEHIDSWTDIAGYARLVELQLTKEKQPEGITNDKSIQEPNATSSTNAYHFKIRKKAWRDTVCESVEGDRRSDSSRADGC